MQPDYEEEKNKQLDQQAAQVINDQIPPSANYPIYLPAFISIIPALIVAHLFKGRLADQSRLALIIGVYVVLTILISFGMHFFLKKRPGSKARFYLK